MIFLILPTPCSWKEEKKKKQTTTVQVIGKSHLHLNGLFSSGSAYVSLKWYKLRQLLFSYGFKPALII